MWKWLKRRLSLKSESPISDEQRRFIYKGFGDVRGPVVVKAVEDIIESAPKARIARSPDLKTRYELCTGPLGPWVPTGASCASGCVPVPYQRDRCHVCRSDKIDYSWSLEYFVCKECGNKTGRNGASWDLETFPLGPPCVCGKGRMWYSALTHRYTCGSCDTVIDGRDLHMRSRI
jgi:hypothetical protein